MKKRGWKIFTLFLFLLATAGQAQQPGVQSIDVKLGKDLKNREIIGETSDFNLNDKVYLWIRISGAAGHNITVIWKHDDLIQATELTVGGSPWRTWASKTVRHTGEWLVTVTDEGGQVLKEVNFTVK